MQEERQGKGRNRQEGLLMNSHRFMVRINEELTAIVYASYMHEHEGKLSFYLGEELVASFKEYKHAIRDTESDEAKKDE